MIAAVEDHLATLPPERREMLQRVRRAILRICPHASEYMHAGIPTYTLDDHPFLSIASRKNYMVLYIVPHDLLNVFKTEMRQYDHGRSCIRFKKLDPQFFDLIERVIRYTGSQLSTSRFYKPEASGKIAQVTT